MSLVHEPKNNP